MQIKSMVICMLIMMFGVVLGRYWPNPYLIKQTQAKPMVVEKQGPELTHLPVGCKRIYTDPGIRHRYKNRRIPKVVFVQCILLGNWAVLATITPQGAKMHTPVQISN